MNHLLTAGLASCVVLAMACSSDSPTAPSGTQLPVDFPIFDDAVTAGFTFELDAETLTVIFTNLSTGEPTKYRWNFGDGRTSNDFEPVHTYREGSSYVVTLTASDAISSDTQTDFVVFTPVVEPTASFSVSTDTATLTAIFTNTSSGDPTSFSWEFGDGATSREENPAHTYAKLDTYVATLTVTNSKGSSSKTEFVTFTEDTGGGEEG